MVASADTRLVVFDGLCNVCSGWVRFLQRHEIKPPFRLVPMQSEAGRALLALAQVTRLVPRVLRDSLCGLVARNRYRWFGRRTTCYVPLPLPKFDSADTSEYPRADEGSQTERARRPDGCDGR
jgi:predicted DCC family thiol-disulfide oxidoreductase YuxK